MTLPTGIVTFLCGQIEESERWGADAPEARASIEAYHRIVQQAIQAAQGQLVKLDGADLCAVFRSPRQALEAAISAQRALHVYPWTLPSQLRVRMALHTDSASLLRENEYEGQALSRAARLLEAGHGGQILLSHTSEALLRDDLPVGLELYDRGEQRLQDLLSPLRIYQVLTIDLPVDLRPLRTLSARPNNLPVLRSTLIGRHEEQQQIRALLQQQALVTLTGPAGMGKTRLALHVAASMLETFADGVYLVSLAPIRDPQLVLASIAHVLGVTEARDLSLLDTVKLFLRDRQLLLLLDNFEHVVEAATIVLELLEGAPRLKVLVTSRELLHLRAEREFLVPSLNVPPQTALTSGQLLSYDSACLFLDRALASYPVFVLAAEHVPAIAGICQRLDGLPLAIELAAARTKLFSPPQLLERLSRRLQVLTGGARDLPIRQQTLRNAIAWSYDLLSEAEQRLFGRLGVCAGGCTLDAAEMICALEDEDLDALNGITSLVDKHLLYPRQSSSGQPRFFMYETVREFALEQLAQHDELELFQRRHLRYYLQLAETQEGSSRGAQQAEWLTCLDDEHSNLRAALSYALDQSDGCQEALRIMAAIWTFWQIHGHLSEGLHWFRRALQQCGEATPARCRALWGAGWIAFVSGAVELSLSYFEQGVALARALGQQHTLGLALHGVGSVARLYKQLDEAQAAFEESLPLFQALQDHEHVAWTLQHLGCLSLVRGAQELAISQLEQSLTAFYRINQRWAIATTLRLLGSAERERASYLRAMQLFEESLSIYDELGDKLYVGRLYVCLACVKYYQQDLEEGKRLYREGMLLGQGLGDKTVMLEGMRGLACIAYDEGFQQWAVRLWRSAEALRQALSAPVWPDMIPHYERMALKIQRPEDLVAPADSELMSFDEAMSYALSYPA